MGDEVQHHRIAVGLDCPGHFELLREGLFRAGQQVVDLLVAGLKADLDMVQPGFFEVADLLLGQTDARGDQVGIETQLARFANQLSQILAHQRFATGEPQLRCTHLPRLAKHLDPLLGAQFFALLGEVQRVGTIRALQRTAVGQFSEKPQRQADLWLGRDKAVRQVRSSALHEQPP